MLRKSSRGWHAVIVLFLLLLLPAIVMGDEVYHVDSNFQGGKQTSGTYVLDYDLVLTEPWEIFCSLGLNEKVVINNKIKLDTCGHNIILKNGSGGKHGCFEVRGLLTIVNSSDIPSKIIR